jgi:hypothetical protein
VEECETVIVVSIGLAVQALLPLGCSVAHFVVVFWAPSSSLCGDVCVCVCGGWVGNTALLLLLLLLFCEAAKERVAIQSVCLAVCSVVCSDGDVLSGCLTVEIVCGCRRRHWLAAG